MGKPTLKFPWYPGNQHRTYSDDLAVLKSVLGEPDGIVYEKKRGEKVKTRIVCQGRGLRWQFLGPYHGYLERIALSDDTYINLAHIHTDSTINFQAAPDSYAAMGMTMQGMALKGTKVDSLNNHAFACAAQQSAFNSSALPLKSYFSTIAIFMPCKKAEELIDSTWPVLQQTIANELSVAAKKGHSIATRPASQIALRCAHDLLHCNYEGDIRYQFIRAKYYELLCHLNELFKTADTSINLSGLEREAIMSAREKLVNNIREPYSLNELASIVDLPPERLISGFKTLYGSTVYQLIKEERMKQAERQLMYTDNSVAHIAEEVGYQSVSSFIRTFKELHGVTPKKFRCM